MIQRWAGDGMFGCKLKSWLHSRNWKGRYISSRWAWSR